MSHDVEQIQKIHEYDWHDEININDTLHADGDHAYMAHPVWRARLFPIGRKKREEYWTHKYTNEYGDKYYIFAPEELRPCPDMLVLVALVALMQHWGQDTLSINGETSGFIGARFPFKHLLEATGIERRNKKRLLESLQRLGGVHFTVKYADASQHRGSTEVVISALFSCEIDDDDMITVVAHRAFLPKVGMLWRSTADLKALHSDIARGVYWILSSRTHYKGSLDEWQQLLGITTPRRADMWIRRQWKPAMQELIHNGYDIHTTTERGITYWTISRPTKTRSQKKSQKSSQGLN